METPWSAPVTETLRAGAETDLTSFDRGGKHGFDGDKALGKAYMRERGRHLAELQEKLYAAGRSGESRSVLLVIQGMDTAGKGGIARHVLGMVDPQGVTVSSFGVPTEEERAHHYLWRIEQRLPRPGRIGVFDRSHYEDVLVVRVHDLVPRDVWEPRYEEINAWEQEVVASGTTIVKCALLVSKDEQLNRLADRLHRPDKYWKYSTSDLDERAHWDDYQQAYQAMLTRTSTDHAPWYTIPANRKWFARLAVTELLIDALERLDLEWPEPDFDLAHERARIERLRLSGG